MADFGLCTAVGRFGDGSEGGGAATYEPQTTRICTSPLAPKRSLICFWSTNTAKAGRPGRASTFPKTDFKKLAIIEGIRTATPLACYQQAAPERGAARWSMDLTPPDFACPKSLALV